MEDFLIEWGFSLPNQEYFTYIETSPTTCIDEMAIFFTFAVHLG